MVWYVRNKFFVKCFVYKNVSKVRVYKMAFFLFYGKIYIEYV